MQASEIESNFTHPPSALSEQAQSISERVEHVFLRSASAALTQNNHITCLLDSRENFPAWLQAISQAQHSITIEMYIFAKDAFGLQVRDALLERLQNGVQVFMVYDWLGCLMPHYSGFFKPLIQAGAHIHAYNPLTMTTGLALVGRNHRKSFVIDRHTAFVSGLCISSQWDGNGVLGISPWRDTGLMLQGPIVEDVLDAFLDTWQAMSLPVPDILTQAAPNPTPENTLLENKHLASARLVATTASNANMMRLDLLAVSMAQKNLWLTDAYFMPTKLYTQALLNAAKDGVDVRILVPSSSDIKWIGTVSRTQYRPLLEAGVRVFEWDGTMIHAKIAIVDGVWARVGSTNLNFSSWFANRELDVAIEDAHTVSLLEQHFLKDLENSTEVVLDAQCQARLTEERQAKVYRPHHLQHLKNPFNHSQRSKALQKMAQLGSSLESVIHGSRVVDDHEAGAYLSIGLVLLGLCVLLYFVPQIVIYPMIFLLLIGGASICIQAIHQLYQLRLKAKAQRSKQSE